MTTTTQNPLANCLAMVKQHNPQWQVAIEKGKSTIAYIQKAFGCSVLETIEHFIEKGNQTISITEFKAAVYVVLLAQYETAVQELQKLKENAETQRNGIVFCQGKAEEKETLVQHRANLTELTRSISEQHERIAALHQQIS